MGGQAARPQVAALAFQLPLLPGLAPLARLTAAALGLGLVLGAAAALRGALASRQVRHFAGAPASVGPCEAPSTAVALRCRGVGANGAWFAPSPRPGGLEDAPLRSRPEEGTSYALPGGVVPPARLEREWELQARLYAAAWVGARDTLLPPTPRGRGPVTSHSVASRPSGAACPPPSGRPTGPASSPLPPQLRRQALSPQDRPQWRPLRQPCKLQWRL